MHTEKGQSGSPVFEENNKMKAIGIHKGYDLDKKMNVFTLINDEMLKEIKWWIQKWNITLVAAPQKNEAPLPIASQLNKESLELC